MSQYVIGIDVGGTNLRVALIDEALTVIKKENINTCDIQTIDNFVATIREMIAKVDPEKLANKIGMVVPAPWKDGMEYFRDATNVQFLENVSIKNLAQQFPEHDVFFENDVNIVTLLEANLPQRQAVSSLMYITVSTGIGSGIVINGQVWQGAHGYAGEVGNMIVSNSDPELNIVLEDVCSGLALDIAAQTLFGPGTTAETLFEAYQRGDKHSVDTIDSWFITFTDALTSIMHVMNPDTIVLGGSVINNNEWLVAELESRTRKKLFENLRENLKIELTHFGNDSGILGGAQLCLLQK